MKKNSHKKTETGDMLRIITIGIIIAFVISLIPIIISSRYVYPQADDFCYAFKTHAAWVRTRSFWSVICAAFDVSISYWINWQGTYSSSFLMSLQPAIYGEKYYHIVPMLLIILFAVSTLILVKAFIGDCLKQPWYLFFGIAGLMTFTSIQNVKDQAEAITWYNGGIHYTGMYAIWMLFMSTEIYLLRAEIERCSSLEHKIKRRNVFLQLLACFMAFIVGGGSNTVVLLALLVDITMLFVLFFFYSKKVSYSMIPSSLILFIGSIVNLTSIGNAKRLECIGGNHNGIIGTIIKSFGEGARFSIKWMDGAVILYVLWMIPFIWVITGKMRKTSEFRFPLPGLVLAYSYCLISALFAPNMYTFGSADLRRTQNAIFYVYVLLIAINLFYFIGWMRMRNYKIIAAISDLIANNEKRAFISALIITVVICGAMLINQPYCFTSSASAAVYVSGRGQSFADVAEYNFDQLYDKSKPDVVLKVCDDIPQLLRSDEMDVWGSGARAYYGKKSVKYENSTRK